MRPIALAVFLFKGSRMLRWIVHLGAAGLIVLGIIDNSVIPVPGSMDVLTIYMAAAHRNLWFYYAAMATAGALIGGYLTFRIGREGGKEILDRKLTPRQVETVNRKFAEHGFWSVAVPAVLPPPFPIVPFLLGAGALDYPRRKFLVALAAGRGVRFTILAFVAHIYGRQIVGWFSQYYKPVLYALIALSVLASLGGLAYGWWRKRHPKGGRHGAKAKASDGVKAA